jgi:hypothetical protein
MIGIVECLKCDTARRTSGRVSDPSGPVVDLADRDRSITSSYLFPDRPHLSVQH